MADAYIEGFDASELTGKGTRRLNKSENPYELGTDNYDRWLLGYENGVAEDEENASCEIDWGRLAELHVACRRKAVGFELVYEESCNQFYLTITSAAPTERTVTKSMSFEGAVEAALRWVNGL